MKSSDREEDAVGHELGFLADHPRHIPRIANCQFGAWGFLDPEDSVAGRIERLEKQCNRDRLPLTVIVREEGRLLGSADVVEEGLSDLEALSPWLSCVYVAEDRRGEGIGTRLTRFAEETVSDFGRPRLYLCTWDRRSFYRRLGWRILETVSSRGREADLMVKELRGGP